MTLFPSSPLRWTLLVGFFVAFTFIDFDVKITCLGNPSLCNYCSIVLLFIGASEDQVVF